MLDQLLGEALANLPENASEPVVGERFIPSFLKTLGFGENEWYPQYNTGSGPVDFATRKNTEEDQFLYTQTNPYLIVEIKGRNINLSEGSAEYKKTVKQIKRYLLAKHCKTVQWGIITNANHIQLFRKHGKVIFPVTTCQAFNINNIDEVIAQVKQKIENPSRALTICVYNNKGGVGKTTTTINIAAILAALGKQVLAVDFDPNQRDLTKSLNINPGNKTWFECWNENKDISEAIHTYTYEGRRTGAQKHQISFDIIPSPLEPFPYSELELRKQYKVTKLRKFLSQLKADYDYILIDPPPNKMFFNENAICASDVVLIPTKHNCLQSLDNAALVVAQYIPEIQQHLKESVPVALPIFFNGEKISAAQKNLAKQEINKIIRVYQKKYNFNLLPYFYPRATSANRDDHIFTLPGYANIANATFARVPAVYKYRTARAFYLGLVKEYFLQ